MKSVTQSLQYNAPLAHYTTFQLGGPCKALITAGSPSSAEIIVRHFIKEKQEYLIIGRGSNLLVSDQGVDVFVVRFLHDDLQLQHDGHILEVSAGSFLDDVVAYSVRQGLDGLVSLSGIPGTLGGAIVGNAGAFGQQISDRVVSVRVLTGTGAVQEVFADQIGFRYRYSAFKEKHDMILTVKLFLSSGDTKALAQEREKILQWRQDKHPSYHEMPCAGSFFRNIESPAGRGKRQSAGRLLEQVQARSMRCGGARVYDKHANIIIKCDGCTAADVFALSRMMADKVKHKFDVELVKEVCLIGSFPPSK
jgi:UDP-N-acetylmuramate dehydrogenase